MATPHCTVETTETTVVVTVHLPGLRSAADVDLNYLTDDGDDGRQTLHLVTTSPSFELLLPLVVGIDPASVAASFKRKTCMLCLSMARGLREPVRGADVQNDVVGKKNEGVCEERAWAGKEQDSCTMAEQMEAQEATENEEARAVDEQEKAMLVEGQQEVQVVVKAERVEEEGETSKQEWVRAEERTLLKEGKSGVSQMPVAPESKANTPHIKHNAEEPKQGKTEIIRHTNSNSKSLHRERNPNDLSAADRCTCGSTKDLKSCARCKQVSYCGAACQKEDWRAHKKFCKLVTTGQVDTASHTGEFVGTFRWSQNKEFPPLPAAFPPALLHPDSLKAGWNGYFQTRLGAAYTGPTSVDPAMVDALSSPLSAVLFLRQALEEQAGARTLHLLIVGATHRAEERVATNTSYWEEIGFFFPRVQVVLHLIGPEMSVTSHDTRVSGHVAANVEYHFFRGDLRDYIRAKGTPLDSDREVVMGFNTGFGAGNHDLLLSWLPDLTLLLASGAMALFTCANDYGDLKGETAVMSHILGARTLAPPNKNPFRAASYVHEPGKKKTAWSCSSSFIYAMQGYGEGRVGPLLVDPSRKDLQRFWQKHELSFGADS